jgi:hypothetical protein
MEISRLGVFCERYGPGRLPRSDHRTVGAGYAVAAAALLACGLFVGGSLVALQFAPGAGFPLTYVLFGTAALPLVAVSGFLAGAVTWRVIDVSSPAYGALAGFVATVGTHLLATAFLVPVFLVAAYGTWSFSVAGAVGTALLFGLFGTLFTCWVTLPVGTLVGYLHERVRADAAPAAADYDTQNVSEQS